MFLNEGVNFGSVKAIAFPPQTSSFLRTDAGEQAAGGGEWF